MESKITKKGAVLLPEYFKKIGLVVMFLALAPTIFFKSINIEIIQTQKDLIRVFTLNAFILGLAFIASSKDKVEDEMTIL